MSKNKQVNTKQKQKRKSPLTQSPVLKINMLMKFKKFQNKIFVHMKTFDVTIDHILVHFIGSKVGLYVSFLICLQYRKDIYVQLIITIFSSLMIHFYVYVLEKKKEYVHVAKIQEKSFMQSIVFNFLRFIFRIKIVFCKQFTNI